jgi:hypothetical protein
MSISFAPIQKCWPILSVRKFTDDEIMTALWFRQTMHIQGYFCLTHSVASPQSTQHWGKRANITSDSG